MQSLASESAPSTHQPALTSQPAPCTHHLTDPALDEVTPPSSSGALVLLTARSPKQSAQKHASATVALAGTAKRSRSAQAFEEDDGSSSSSSRQAGSPSTSVPSDAMNKSAKRARHTSPQSKQQAELPTASAAEGLLSSGSPALSSWWCVSVKQSCLCSQTQKRKCPLTGTQSLADQLL